MEYSHSRTAAAAVVAVHSPARHFAYWAGDYHSESGPAAQEEPLACTPSSHWTLSPHDREEAEAPRWSSSGFSQAAARPQRCWRKRHLAGRKMRARNCPVQKGGRSRALAGLGIEPCSLSLSCFASSFVLCCCIGTESARHPALSTAHRPLRSPCFR